MPDASEWDESLFRRSLVSLVERPPADGQALWQFHQYWVRSLDDAEAAGAITGIKRDVLFADLQDAVRELPRVTFVEYSSGGFLGVAFTPPED